MAATPRNSLCPCGSGKKYKRCCITKDQATAATPTKEMIMAAFEAAAKKQDIDAKNALKTLKRYNSAHVLKVLALLQVQPRNHGKNIRLENAVIETIRNINLKPDTLNLSSLIKDIKENCKGHYAEDPPEEFFTENIVYENGNNIVFPGISANGTEIVQGLVTCLSLKECFSPQFIDEAKAGILLILHIHSSIAKSLGFLHRMFEEDLPDEVFVPDERSAMEMMKLFSFKQESIELLSKQLNIASGTFDQFVYDWQKKGLTFTQENVNPLLRRPFICIDEEFILVMPTAELTCLNDFIIELAKKHNCLDQLVSLYSKLGSDELLPYFGRMQWSLIRFEFSKDWVDELFFLKESLWKIDENKLAYVTIITEHPSHTTYQYSKTEVFSLQYTKRVESESMLIKERYPGYQILSIGIIHKSRVLGMLGLGLNHLKNVEYQIFFSFLELQVLTRVWKFDKLTIWKYAKYFRMAEGKIQFFPMNTHYSKYDWYIRNGESFLDPDSEPINGATFGFEIESEIRRKGVNKLDKIGIPFLVGDKLSYVQCYRKEEYYPAYISQEVNYGFLNSCFLKYSFPIWFVPAKGPILKTEIYITGILYWLNELYDHLKNYINKLGADPILFVVGLDKEFENISDLDLYDEKPTHIRYSIDKIKRRIEFIIPVEILQYTSSPDNKGEQYLMKFIIDMFGELMEQLGLGTRLPEIELDQIIELAIPFGNRKMILTATGERDLKIAEIDIDKARTIPKADASYILENQVSWLNLPDPIPKKIKENKDKIQLFNAFVALHFNKLTNEIRKYNAYSLILFLMRRHESLIQARSFRKVNYPAKQSCYGKFYDVYKEFAESEAEINFSSLSHRVLIEFVACLMPSGELQINDDDADMLVTLAGKIIQYGSMSDEIKYEVRDMEVGLLPSGRIGIDRTARRDAFDSFSNQVYAEEFDSYAEDFSLSFLRRRKEAPKTGERDSYNENVNEVFKREWGIGIYDMMALSYFIAYFLYERGKSVEMFNKKELVDAIKLSSDFAENEINSYISVLAFPQRLDILKPPSGFANSEIYPWRYNRRLSYIMKPIVCITKDNDEFLIISARHLWMSSENIVAAFGNGILKVNPEYKGILQLIADQNSIKGKEYREEVYEWLRDNTTAGVIQHEVKISPRGYFKSSSDMGDVDILAIDDSKRIIYSIECKNTHQAKVAYEFRMEIDSYLGTSNKSGLISKHVNRDKWLNENKETIVQKLGLQGKYAIYSLVVSKHVLPTKFLQSIGIKVISFHELKKNGLPNITDK